MASLFDLDAAVVATLLNDAALMAIAADGVYFGDARSNASRFVTVSRINHDREYEFGDAAWDLVLYQVKVVLLSSSGAQLEAAVARLHALLHDAPLTATGFRVMVTLLQHEFRYSETDSANSDRRWVHGGGQYEIRAIPTT